MALPKVLVDSSFLYALFRKADPDHQAVRAVFATEEAARKLLFLVTQDILRKWTGPIFNWPLILNQLAIRYEDRLSF